MAPEQKADVLRGRNRLFFCLFVSYFFTNFVYNVTATVSYDRKYLIDIRTAITHHGLAESFFFFHDSDEPEAEDIRLPREQSPTPVICVKRRQKRERPESRLPSEE